MRSIDNLRRHVYDTLTRSAAYPINDMIDVIEREVADMVRLPVDADGVPIHVGDVMDGVDKYDSLKEVTGEVITISFDSMGDSKVETSVGLRVWAENGKSYHTSYIDQYAIPYRHHHAPTVEDVLREFIDSWSDTEGREDERRVMDDYAARLRLAGDAE